jgi:hypothetical protein
VARALAALLGWVRAGRVDRRLRHAVRTRSATASYGAAYGFLPIGWIVLNAVFLYNLTVETGQFEIVKGSVGRLSAIAASRRCSSRFRSAPSSKGRRVRHAGRDLFGAADRARLHAALRAGCRSSPTRAGRVRRDRHADPDAGGRHRHSRETLGAMAGRQLPFVSLIVPAWLVVTMSGWRGLRSVWPAVLVCGGTFAVVQFAWSNLRRRRAVDIAGGLASIARLRRSAACGAEGRVGDAPSRRLATRLDHVPPSRRRDSTLATHSVARRGCRGCSQRRGDRVGLPPVKAT